MNDIGYYTLMLNSYMGTEGRLKDAENKRVPAYHNLKEKFIL